jgi:hypothetical protein
MSPAGFETTIPASERPQTHTLVRVATGIRCLLSKIPKDVCCNWPWSIGLLSLHFFISCCMSTVELVAGACKGNIYYIWISSNSNFYHSTLRHTEGSLHIHRCENLNHDKVKYYITCLILLSLPISWHAEETYQDGSCCMKFIITYTCRK